MHRTKFYNRWQNGQNTFLKKTQTPTTPEKTCYPSRDPFPLPQRGEHPNCHPQPFQGRAPALFTSRINWLT